MTTVRGFISAKGASIDSWKLSQCTPVATDGCLENRAQAYGPASQRQIHRQKEHTDHGHHTHKCTSSRGLG